jgi:hypothetical protein
MAGTLVANTINTDTGLFSTNNAYSGIHKAWINFNSSTNTINASFNVSSITLVSTGVTKITFTTAMADTNYTVIAMGIGGGGGACIWGVDSGTAYTGTPTVMTTTQVQLSSRNNAGSVTQMGLTMVQVVGN